ncbi:LrgB family protein [Heyndrickxia oleronia]|uniref:LrgB family protein n=1 Tax=Heyndrickxia oleronia TaxID=38875 RepID=A0AAW6SMP3_9BACI|nr:LrgB family protein [Heyndrickxia oleronia]MCM3236382.1 LrgB family protein [Heyndrickxia oleronia]MDH5159410.1 LrgB family protein [Heyndrickxia oleronia]
MSSIITVYSLMITIFIYLFTIVIAKKYPSPFTTPVFLSTVLIIGVLYLSHITYSQYSITKEIITELLGPATVALAVPLYKNRRIFFQHLKPALLGIILGTSLTIASAEIIGKMMHISNEFLISLSVKSITIPVASEVSNIIGGNEYLVAAFVMITGMFGAMFGPLILNLCKINHPLSRGLAIGTISHGIGTAEAVKEGEIQGAVSGVAMGVAAIFTSICIPNILPLIL